MNLDLNFKFELNLVLKNKKLLVNQSYESNIKYIFEFVPILSLSQIFGRNGYTFAKKVFYILFLQFIPYLQQA